MAQMILKRPMMEECIPITVSSITSLNQLQLNLRHKFDNKQTDLRKETALQCQP